MSDPTITLQSLRRKICQELRMPFFRRYAAGYLDADSGSTTTLVDTALTQGQDFWTGGWIYRVSSQEVALITQFDSKNDTAYFETPITTFANGDDYEIHSLWNAVEIHAAINQAMKDVQRIFPSTNIDQTLVLQEDTLEYDISTLSPVPFIIRKIWFEPSTNVRRGDVQSSTASSIVVENSGVLSGVTSDWMVSIYDGTGKGQLRDVDSIASNELFIASPSWTTLPDTTSKYALWNPTEQIYDWIPYHDFRLSDKEFPDTLYISARAPQHYGLRIRIQYSAFVSALSTEAGTTIIPERYLVPAAISILHGQFISDNRADRDLHFGEARRYSELAQLYLARNIPHEPDLSVEGNPGMGESYSDTFGNPLGWTNR